MFGCVDGDKWKIVGVREGDRWSSCWVVGCQG